jgi:hypothetical protein
VAVDAWVLEAIAGIEGVCKRKPTEVLSLVTRIEALEPADPRLPGLKGMFLLATGNEERALVALEEANRATPLDPLVKLWLAPLVEPLDPERAALLVETALLLSPPPYVLSR